MSTCCAELASSINPRVDSHQPERVQLAEIDASLKWPVLFFVSKAIGWLVLSAIFGLIAAIKLHSPEFLGGCEWLTYGRVRPVFIDAFIYGWGNNAVFAVGLWIMARLCGTKVRHMGILYVAGAFWNLGVLWGIVSILLGDQTSVEWLEMPVHVGPLLVFSYAAIAVWGILCFHYRQPGTTYVSQWYLLAALFWFGWIYFVAQLMVVYFPVRGVVQAVVDAWYVNNVMDLWFTPVALAATYYLLPKILGKPLAGYYLAILGFWAYALFASWAGMRQLVWSPVPVWLQTTGIVGSMMLIVPLLIVSINFLVTAWQNASAVWASLPLRFLVFGAVAYLAFGLLGALFSLRGLDLRVHFTQIVSAHSQHGLYAFFAMTMFGAIYFMLPRVLGREWPSTALMHAHFWFSALGITLMLASQYIGGWFQGQELLDPQIPFLDVVAHVGWIHTVTGVSFALLILGSVAFFINTLWMMVSSCCVPVCSSLITLARSNWAPAGGAAR